MFEELDLVINSAGGNIHAAYQIVELLRLPTKKLNVCVPFYAKSAAALLCIGADTIVFDKLAQLGPLDAQIYEEGKGGKGEFTSALSTAVFSCMSPLLGAQASRLPCKAAKMAALPGHIQISARGGGVEIIS